jgi:nucleolar protein 53
MGKRVQGAELRAKKRAKVNLDQVQERQAEDVAKANVAAKKDTELFVLDVTGDTVHPSQVEPKGKRPKKETGLSEKDKQAVAKLMAKHDGSALKLKEIAAKGRKAVVNQRRVRPKGLKGQTAASFDLWSSIDSDAAAASLEKPKPVVLGGINGISLPRHDLVKARRAQKPSQKGVAVDVAQGGQSYHPDPVAHKRVIDKAAGIETRRNAANHYNDTPISNGLSAETRAMMVGDSDSEDDEDNNMDVDDGEDDGPVGLLPKRSLKLTRAQHNKKRRVREEEAIIDKRRKTKKLLNSVSEIPRYNKEMKLRTRELQDQRDLEQKTKDAKLPPGRDVEQKISNANPVNAPTLPVALSSELKSSLRTIKPKGSLLVDRLTSFRDRKLAPKRAGIDGRKKKFHDGRRRKLRVTGKKNNEGVGSDFVVMG